MGVNSYAAVNGWPTDNASTTGNTGNGLGHTHPGSVAAGQGVAGNNLPAYRAYCYIIKE